MKKSIRRLLSVILALVLTVGLFPGVTAVHASAVSANEIEIPADTGDTENLEKSADTETGVPDAEVSDTEDINTEHPEPHGAVEDEIDWSKREAFWAASESFDKTVEAFWEKEDAFWAAYEEFYGEEKTLSEAQWNNLYRDWKDLSKNQPSKQAAVDAAYKALEAAYNNLSDTEKNYKDTNDDGTEWDSPEDVMNGNAEKEECAKAAHEDIMKYELPELPESPYLQPYLDRLDAENGVYPLLGAAGDAMAAFDDANAAYQEELDKENPDSAALDSLYKAALEKYNQLIAADNALEKEYKALEALYQKIPDEERAIEYGDGNGVSIEWNGLSSEIADHRNNMKDKVKPAPLGKNVNENILPGAPSTKLVYTDKDAILASIGLTDEEKSKASVEVVLQAAPKSLTQAESELTASKLPNGYVTGCALDLSMYLNLNGTKARDITKTASPVSVSVTIPQDLINTDTTVTRTYKIVRIHDNDAQVLDGTYNPQDHSFTFSTDCFSTYVIIYKDEKVEVKPAVNSSQASTTQPAGTIKAPKTGDDTPLTGLFAVMFSSLALGIGSIGFYVWRRKKSLTK